MKYKMMNVLNEFLKFIKDNPASIAFLSLLVSCFSFYISFSSYRNFVRNEFVKKQIQVVTDLVSHLHEDSFHLSFTRYNVNGYAAGDYITTIFELSELKVLEKDEEFFENPICFSRNCNQVLDIKKFVRNPFLPKSIADELVNFYSRNHIDVNIASLNGDKVIIIDSKHFEKGLFEIPDPKSRIIKHSTAFALQTYENFRTCSINLEDAITKWLKSYKVQEINIRKDFMYV
jgi:hypothetical protein